MKAFAPICLAAIAISYLAISIQGTSAAPSFFNKSMDRFKGMLKPNHPSADHGRDSAATEAVEQLEHSGVHLDKKQEDLVEEAVTGAVDGAKRAGQGPSQVAHAGAEAADQALDKAGVEVSDKVEDQVEDAIEKSYTK